MKSPKSVIILICVIVLLGICIVPPIMWACNNNLIIPVIVVVAALLIYVAIIIKLNLNKTKSGRIIETAVDDNTYVTATRVGKIKHYPADIDSNNPNFNYDRYGATYEYTVDGKKYKYKCIFKRDVPPDEIVLFYPKGKPKKAVLDNTEKLGGKFNVLMIIIPIVIVVVALMLFGVINIRNLMI